MGHFSPQLQLEAGHGVVSWKLGTVQKMRKCWYFSKVINVFETNFWQRTTCEHDRELVLCTELLHLNVVVQNWPVGRENCNFKAFPFNVHIVSFYIQSSNGKSALSAVPLMSKNGESKCELTLEDLSMTVIIRASVCVKFCLSQLWLKIWYRHLPFILRLLYVVH